MKELIGKAEEGDAQAQLDLAFRYRDGRGVAKDNGEAMRWAHLAADQGNANAMDFVGWMFFVGRGVERQPHIAAGYFKAAAGNPPPPRGIWVSAISRRREWSTTSRRRWRSGKVRQPWGTVARPRPPR
ncbi:MAG: tetratricopeptide repeat protein [Kiritimatiellia bacterium]